MSPLALLELLLPPGQRMRCNQPSSPLPPRARQAPASSAPARPACVALLLLALWCLAPAAPAQGNSAAGPAPNTSAEARALDLGLGGSGGSSGCNPTLQSCVPPPSDGGTGSPGGSCGPSPGGGTSACNSAGPASMGNSSGTQQGAGNPVHLISGNKYLREVDLPALPGVLGLEIVRHYNSAYSLPNSPLSLLGRGWRLSYETQLRVGPTALQILQADGTRLIFQRQAHNPALCASTDPANGVVTEQAPASGLPQHTRYLWRWPDGRQLLFDHAGLLLSITAPSGETLTLAYDAKGWLRKVTDPQGRSLLLHTTHRPSALADLRQGKDQFMGLQRISSPVGDFHYAHAATLPAGSEHDSALMLGTLSEVSLPAPAGQPPLRRLYHHEDPTFPTLITGISVTVSTSTSTSTSTNDPPASTAGSPALQRLSTYAYNSRGKAILSTLANGVQRVSLSHPGPGITVLTNSLGQSTTYRHAIVHNQWRLLEALGPGCSTCGPSNVRYGYDALGRLTLITQLSPQGRPVSSVRTTLDPQGRTVRTERLSYSTQGRPRAPVLVARYEYPDAPAVAAAGPAQPSLPAPGALLPFPHPSRIARPSVVPGREHITRISYNPHGQPTSVTEAGFSPLNDQGQPQATPIERSTTYAYQLINGRSLLTQIDGPLPNGPLGSPEDSDVTTLQWDGKGDFIAAITRPGGQRSTLDYDSPTGRIAATHLAQGPSTRFGYDAQGHLLSVSTYGPQGALVHSQQMSYDALGQLSRSEDLLGANAQRSHQQAFEFDLAGRLVWQAQATGEWWQNKFDTESRLEQSSHHAGLQASTMRYRYDAEGRLSELLDGSTVQLRLSYDQQGDLSHWVDSLGRTRHLTAATQHSPTSAAGFTGPTQTRTLHDDWGRPVRTLSPDSGTSVRQFDAADRLIASTDALGHQARYQHDLQGRPLSQSVTDARTGQVRLTRWRYDGPRLVALDDPEQSERYEYDDEGRRTARLVILPGAQGREHRISTRYRYDAQGRLESMQLPDGSCLRYQLDALGQAHAVVRSPVCSAWLQWLVPQQRLAEHLQRDLRGLSHYRSGNGLQTLYLRSPEGRLARLLHRHDTDAAQAAQAAQAPQARHQAQPPTLPQLPGLWGLAHAHASPAGASPPPAQPSPANTSNNSNANDNNPAGALGQSPDPQALLDWRYLWDTEGNLRLEQGSAHRQSMAYNERDQLIVSQQTPWPMGAATQAMPQSTSRYAYDRAQRRVLQQEEVAQPDDLHSATQASQFEPGTHRLQRQGERHRAWQGRYNANGQPVQMGTQTYNWDALGRLEAVHQDGPPLARYRYNHRGERVHKAGPALPDTLYHYDRGQLSAELDAQGRIRRQYLYLGTLPLALIDTPEGMPLAPAADTGAGTAPGVALLLHDLAQLWRNWTGQAGQLRWLHNNHLGAPVAVTDAQGQLLWQVHYTPFGRAKAVQSQPGFELALRLPGQYFDAETGLHYNRQRYYDPALGQYLSPDPLGTPNGPNSYAYVGFNPLRYIDPEGLILFAFDGTNNSEPPPGQDTLSNVRKFFMAYDQIANGKGWYMNGVGRDDSDSKIKTNFLDAADANTARERVDYMLKVLDAYVDKHNFTDGRKISIDIVGFSRGAAMGRDFANRVATRLQEQAWGNKTECVELRFMGLWDTVAQFGLNGVANTDWQLAIPPQAKHVFHAVALNERRSIFPGVRIDLGVQRGFVGDHADIGGSYGSGDLSDVALNWMTMQAKSSGLTIKPWTNIGHEEWGVVTEPFLHDKGPLDGSGHSNFCQHENNGREKNCVYRDQARPGGLTAEEITRLGLIVPRSPLGWDADGKSRIAGDVNMELYAQWLKQNYGLTLGGS